MFSAKFLLFIRVICITHSLTWPCPKLNMTLTRARSLFLNTEYGHYSGSCLRSESKDGIYVLCKDANMCGTEVDLGPKPDSSSGTRLDPKLREGPLDCVVYVRAGGDRKCQWLEKELLSRDSNDCVGVTCEEGKCVDRLGYFECVTNDGHVRFNQQCCKSQLLV